MDKGPRNGVNFWNIAISATYSDYPRLGSLRFARKDELQNREKFSRKIEAIFSIDNIVIVTRDQLKNLAKVFKLLSEWSRSNPSRSFSNSKLVDNKDQLE